MERHAVLANVRPAHTTEATHMHAASAMYPFSLVTSVLLLGISTMQVSPRDDDHRASAARDSTRSVSFAVVGDYGLAGQPEADVAALVHSWQTDFVLTVGDNNYPDGEARTIDKNVGQYYSDYIYPYAGAFASSASENRFFPALGNHDWRSISCDSTGCSGPYLDFFTLPGNERYYDFVRGDVHVFVVDSDRSEPDGITSDSKQAEWLQNGLSTSTAAWQIVTLHHAPYSSAKHGSATTLQWPYGEWGADLVIAGHDHVYERIHADGIVYIVNGLGGKSIYSFGAPIKGSEVRYNDDFGALRAVADQTQITLEFVSRTGVVVDQFVIGRHSRTGLKPHNSADHPPRLLPAYPNPALTSARISFELTYPAEATVSIFDLLGRQVVVLVTGMQSAGSHEFTVDATDLPAGLYFYKLVVGRHIETKSLVVLK